MLRKPSIRIHYTGILTAALVLFFYAGTKTALAERVPPHIVSMTKELLLATRDDFTAASGNDEQAQRVKRIYRILKREGLYNWRVTPVTRDGFVRKMAAVFGLSQIGSAETEKLKKFLEAQTGGRSDAAIDELYAALGRARSTGAERKRIVDDWNTLWTETWAGVSLTHEIVASRGPQAISLAWDMDRARFTIRVIDQSDASTNEMQTTITGIVQFAFDQKARNLIVSVRPVQMPITSSVADIQSATAQPVEPRLGPPVKPSDERVEDNGSAVGGNEAKEGKEDVGDGKTPQEGHPGKQEQIDANRRKIEEIEEDKVYVWENTETGEKIRQKRFTKLKEPFEYLGEDHSDPDGAEKIEHLEREIASLESGSPSASEAENTSSEASDEADGIDSDKESTPSTASTGGNIISLSKTIYFHDEPVVITYSVPDSPPFYSVEFKALAAGNNVVRRRLRYRENKKELWFPLPKGIPFIDYAVNVYQSNKKISTTYIRVVRHDPLLRGAIKITGGEIHGFGEAVFIDVDVPSGMLVGENDYINRGTKRLIDLAVVRVGRPMRGGAVTTGNIVCSKKIDAPHMRFDLSNFDGGNCLFKPGLFEIRLITDGFTLDQALLNVTGNELPNSLRLSSSGPLRVGDPISASFDAPGKLLKDFSYSLELLRILKGGRVERLGPSFLRDVKQGQPYTVGTAAHGGNYTVRLKVNRTNSYSSYILDELDFTVGGQQPSIDQFHFTINGTHAHSDQEILVGQSEKISVEVSLRGKFFTPGGILKVSLYKAAKNARARMQGGYMPSPRSDDPIKEWNLDSGRKSAWNIDENLAPGSYDLTIFVELKGQQFPLFARAFQVVPSFRSLKLDFNGRHVFAFGEPITFTVKMPSGYSSSAPPPILDAIRIGGRVPGCAIETFVPPISIDKNADVDGRITYSLSPFRQKPGIYLIRLFNAGTLADEVAIEIVSRPAEGALLLSGGGSYRPGEKFRVSLSLPPDHPLQELVAPDSKFKTEIVIARHGATAVGGSASYVDNMYAQNYSFFGSSFFVTGKSSAEFALVFPGSYEARLYQTSGACGISGNLCPLLAVQPFVVRDPRSPFALKTGLGKIDLRNDIPHDNGPWPPIGEYLTGENCSPRVAKIEKMKLRMVRWEDGRYMPIKGALNFGDAFYLEGRLEEEAQKNAYLAQVGRAGGDTEEVTLFVDEDDPKVVRSELLYFIWESPEEETSGVAQ